jgi:hypothetical protein
MMAGFLEEAGGFVRDTVNSPAFKTGAGLLGSMILPPGMSPIGPPTAAKAGIDIGAPALVGGVTDFAAGLSGLSAEEEAIFSEPKEPKEPEDVEKDKIVQIVSDVVDQSGDSPTFDSKRAEAQAEGRNLTPEEATAAASVDQKAAAEKFMQEQDPSGSWKGAWDRFNEDYDLTTLGLNMMALSGRGDMNFTQKLGLSMQAGRQARVAQIDKGIAGSTAARKEAREERKVRVEELKAQAEARRKEAQTQIDSAQLEADATLLPFEVANIKADTRKKLAQAQKDVNDTGGEVTKNKPFIESTEAILVSEYGLDEEDAKAAGFALAQRTQEALDRSVELGKPMSIIAAQAYALREAEQSGRLRRGGFFSDGSYTASGN